jgi:hypothetical protein
MAQQHWAALAPPLRDESHRSIIVNLIIIT